VLEHSLIFACIEIAAAEETAKGLAVENSPQVRRAALIALDQMEGKRLEPQIAVAELKSPDPDLRESAAWILGRHPEWGEVLVDVLQQRLTDENTSESDRRELSSQLGRYAGDDAIQLLLGRRLAAADAKPAERLTILNALGQTWIQVVPESWTEGLAVNLASENVEVTAAAVSTVRALKSAIKTPGPLPDALRAVARRKELSLNVRLDALAAMPGEPAGLSDELFDFLRLQLDPATEAGVRVRAAEVLSESKLNSSQLISLAEVVRNSSPLEVGYLIKSFSQSTEPQVGLQLVAALKESPALSGMRSESLKPILAKFGEPLESGSKELLQIIDARSANELATLEEFLRTMPKGDANRGQAIFNQKKVACTSCHSIGDLGGRVGPDLTRIGQIRTERDLVESILFPSLSFVRSYEPLVIVTKQGKTYSGTVRRDTAEEIVLATGPNQEIRVPRDDIDEVHAGKVSVMPAGLDKLLSAQDLADLVVFLKACK
jgi:putative heme-binding domain-containing protein